MSRCLSLRAWTAASCVLALGACGGSHKVKIENETTRTIYAGAFEQKPGASKMLKTVTIEPEKTEKFSVSPEGGRGSVCVLMLGDTPSPRSRARNARLEKGDNEFKVKQVDDDPKSPIFLERQE